MSEGAGRARMHLRAFIIEIIYFAGDGGPGMGLRCFSIFFRGNGTKGGRGREGGSFSCYFPVVVLFCWCYYFVF